MVNDWVTHIGEVRGIGTQLGPLRNLKYLQKPLENLSHEEP